MEKPRTLPRRGALAGLAALGATPALAKTSPSAGKPPASGMLSGADFGIVAGSIEEQSKAVQQALDAAHEQGKPLLLPGGQIQVRGLEFPSNVRVMGQPGGTVLLSYLGEAIGKAELANDLVLDGIGFAGSPGDSPGDHGLLQITDSVGVRIANCRFMLAATSGLLLQNSEAVIADCGFDQLDIAIFSHNSRGLTIYGNQVTQCGNGGILIWRDQPGRDGSIVSGNRISHVLARSGGTGQNGNGINVFMADDVIVSDNVIDDCAFSAVRANSTRNVQIRGNTCTNGREVAIYSEFAFSGSVIANNIIDGAASGISMTNLDKGGRLAVCTGNLVRNIDAISASDPSAKPYGIYAEGDTAITGNTVSDIPGFGIAAGFGEFLKTVLIASNVVTAVDTGIAVSVADKAGTVRIAGNLLSGTRVSAIAGLQWDKVASPDLVADAGRFPNVVVEGNTIVP